jgi:hypothetical protein
VTRIFGFNCLLFIIGILPRWLLIITIHPTRIPQEGVPFIPRLKDGGFQAPGKCKGHPR